MRVTQLSVAYPVGKKNALHDLHRFVCFRGISKYITYLFSLHFKTFLSWDWQVLQKICFFSAHIFTGLTTLETAQSVFLQMAAENFLVTWTTLAMETVIQDLIVDHQQQVTGVVHKVLECLTRSLKEMKLSCPGLAGHSVTVPSVSSSQVTVSQIFQRLSSVQEFCQWKVQDVDFMKTIAVLSLHHSSAKIRQLLLQTLLHVYNYM